MVLFPTRALQSPERADILAVRKFQSRILHYRDTVSGSQDWILRLVVVASTMSQSCCILVASHLPQVLNKQRRLSELCDEARNVAMLLVALLK